MEIINNGIKKYKTELRNIKQEIMHLKSRQAYKNNLDLENNISSLKTSFRRIQRQNILFIEKKNLKSLK
jgi:hypothetical protein